MNVATQVAGGTVTASVGIVAKPLDEHRHLSSRCSHGRRSGARVAAAGPGVSSSSPARRAVTSSRARHHGASLRSVIVARLSVALLLASFSHPHREEAASSERPALTKTERAGAGLITRRVATCPGSLIVHDGRRRRRLHRGRRTGRLPRGHPTDPAASGLMGALNDERRDHAEHPVVALGVGEDVAVARPDSGLPFARGRPSRARAPCSARRARPASVSTWYGLREREAVLGDHELRQAVQVHRVDLQALVEVRDLDPLALLARSPARSPGTTCR